MHTLDTDKRAALQAFANKHGKKWKNILAYEYWSNARIWEGGTSRNMGNILHGIRNNYGSRWLHEVCDIKPEPKPK